MIKFLAGEKGTGKTKKIIDMANSAVKTTDGHIVFIDDDTRYMFDLSHKIRFVETANFPLSNYRELIGFICGILSQDGDIKEIYIDGLTKIVKAIPNEDLIKLISKLSSLSEQNAVDFIISISRRIDDMPEEAKPLLYA